MGEARKELRSHTVELIDGRESKLIATLLAPEVALKQ